MLTNDTNYKCLRADRSNFVSSRATGGGVVIFVKDNINTKPINAPVNTTIEHVTALLEINTKHICLCNIYLPPYNKRWNELIIEVYDTLLWLNNNVKFDQLILCGDFNMSGIQWINNDDAYAIPDDRRIAPHERLFIK